MLLLMMELKGRFNQKTIKKAKFGDTYFDDMGGFDSIEKDRVTGAVSLLRVLLSRSLIQFYFFPGRGAQGTHIEAGARPSREAHAACVGSDEGRREQASYVICRSVRQVSCPRPCETHHSQGGAHASLPSRISHHPRIRPTVPFL